MTPDLVDPVLAVHLKGAFNVTQAAWPLMREQGYGRIISTSSAAGIFGNLRPGQLRRSEDGSRRVHPRPRRGRRQVQHQGQRDRSAGAHQDDREHLRQDRDKLDPALISPLVTYLASEECEATGRVFSVGGGRVAEVFIAETQGYFQPSLSPEDVRDNWATITDQDGYAVPANIGEETALFFKFLK